MSCHVALAVLVLTAVLAAGEAAPRFAIGAHSLALGHRVTVVPGLGQKPWVDEDSCRWQLTMHIAADRPVTVLACENLAIVSAITDAKETVTVKALANAGVAGRRDSRATALAPVRGTAPVPAFVLALPVARASYQGFARLRGSIDVLYAEAEPTQSALPADAKLHVGVEIPGVAGATVVLSDRGPSRLTFVLNPAAARVLADVVVMSKDGAVIEPRARTLDVRAGGGSAHLTYAIVVPAEASFALRWHAVVLRHHIDFDLAGLSCGVALPGSVALRGPQRLGADEF